MHGFRVPALELENCFRSFAERLTSLQAPHQAPGVKPRSSPMASGPAARQQATQQPGSLLFSCFAGDRPRLLPATFHRGSRFLPSPIQLGGLCPLATSIWKSGVPSIPGPWLECCHHRADRVMPPAERNSHCGAISRACRLPGSNRQIRTESGGARKPGALHRT